jgi:hypothetical protein
MADDKQTSFVEDEPDDATPFHVEPLHPSQPDGIAARLLARAYHLVTSHPGLARKLASGALAFLLLVFALVVWQPPLSALLPQRMVSSAPHPSPWPTPIRVHWWTIGTPEVPSAQAPASPSIQWSIGTPGAWSIGTPGVPSGQLRTPPPTP